MPYIDDEKKHSEEGYVPDWKFMKDYIRSLLYGDRLWYKYKKSFDLLKQSWIVL